MGDGVHHLARFRAARELERSKEALAASLRDLERGLEHTFSPRRAVRAHLGWLLAGAFAMGVGLAMRKRE